MASKLIEAELKSTRVVPFSGKKDDWDMWQIKHLGRSSVIPVRTRLKLIASLQDCSKSLYVIVLNSIISFSGSVAALPDAI